MSILTKKNQEIAETRFNSDQVVEVLESYGLEVIHKEWLGLTLLIEAKKP